MEVIRSQNNNKIKNWCKLHEKKYREKEQMFLIENEHLIQEALQANLVQNLILLENKNYDFNYNGEITVVSEDVMKKLKMSQSMPLCMALVKMPKVNPNLGNRIIICKDCPICRTYNIDKMIRL